MVGIVTRIKFSAISLKIVQMLLKKPDAFSTQYKDRLQASERVDGSIIHFLPLC
jgi:hypothetical protein